MKPYFQIWMLKTYRAALKILLYTYIYYSTDALVESGN